jgi:hypothetical protein
MCVRWATVMPLRFRNSYKDKAEQAEAFLWQRNQYTVHHFSGCFPAHLLTNVVECLHINVGSQFHACQRKDMHALHTGMNLSGLFLEFQNTLPHSK